MNIAPEGSRYCIGQISRFCSTISDHFKYFRVWPGQELDARQRLRTGARERVRIAMEQL